MSIDIDMQSYAGERDSVAGNQQGTNTYQNEQGNYEFHPELMENPPEQAESQPLDDPMVNPQAEHFRALREEVDRIKAERETEKKDHQLQLDMLRANMAQQQQPTRQAEPVARKMFEGMNDDDVPNVAELRREWNQKEADYQSRLEELQVAQMHPDYAEVLEKYALPLVKQKPHLAEGIQGARNKALFAYELGKMAQQMQAQQPIPQPKNENAQRMVDNAKKPGTLSQAGGQSVLSKADYFATMSDAEFMRMASRNLESI